MYVELNLINCLLDYINDGVPRSLFAPRRSRIEGGGPGIGGRMLSLLPPLSFKAVSGVCVGMCSCCGEGSKSESGTFRSNLIITRGEVSSQLLHTSQSWNQSPRPSPSLRPCGR